MLYSEVLEIIDSQYISLPKGKPSQMENNLVMDLSSYGTMVWSPNSSLLKQLRFSNRCIPRTFDQEGYADLLVPEISLLPAGKMSG